jgi:DnaJ-domain-containing protein 1
VSILDEIRDGLSALFERVGGDDGPVPDIGRDQVVAEIERRAEARRGVPLGVSHPIALRAASDPKARAARERVAAKRDATIRKQRDQRSARDQAAREAAFEDMKRRAAEEARRGGGAPTGARAAGGSWRDKIPLGRDAAIAKHYETLNLPYGTPFPEVKKRFRELMRKYHPDMHSATPEKHKAASELSKQISVAYAALEKHLEG